MNSDLELGTNQMTAPEGCCRGLQQATNPVESLCKRGLTISLSNLAILAGIGSQILQGGEHISGTAKTCLIILGGATSALSLFITLFISDRINYEQFTTKDDNLAKHRSLLVLSLFFSVFTVNVFFLLVNMKFVGLGILQILLVPMTMFIMHKEKQAQLDKNESVNPVNSEQHESVLKLNGFTMTAARVGIATIVIASLGSKASELDHRLLEIEFIMFYLFLADFLSFFATLLILNTTPLLETSCLILSLTCASLCPLALATLEVAYSLVNSYYVFIVLVPALAGVMICWIVELFNLQSNQARDNGTSASTNRVYKLEIWVIIAGLEFSLLTNVYTNDLSGSRSSSSVMIKILTCITASAFICGLVHMLIAILRPIKSCESRSWRVFYWGMSFLHAAALFAFWSALCM